MLLLAAAYSGIVSIVVVVERALAALLGLMVLAEIS